MKQIIILLLLIIAFFIGFGKYQDYQRFKIENVNYVADNKLDLDYHNQDIVYSYLEAVEDLNQFVVFQNSANQIDVRTPEEDDEATKLAVQEYAKKIAKVKYYENFLVKSQNLKNNGLTNKEIKFLEKENISVARYKEIIKNKKIKNLFNPNNKYFYGEKSHLVYEVQQKLFNLGDSIRIDGIYKFETQKAIKDFEEKNKVFADGILDIFTLDLLFNTDTKPSN